MIILYGITAAVWNSNAAFYFSKSFKSLSFICKV